MKRNIFYRVRLKLNHWYYAWYYDYAPVFFHKWTYRTSVKLLIENYNHDKLLTKNDKEHLKDLIKVNNELRKELSDIRIKQVASNIPTGEKIIDWANKNLGSNIHKDNEN